HDANGNLSTVTYPGGLVASYAHDAMDREQSLSVQPAGGTAVPVVAATPGASYRPFGPLAELTFGTVPPTTETRGHDFRYAPTGIALSGGQFAWTYTTDANGNVLSISDGTGGGDDRSFGYQEWQQYLTTATGPWGSRYWSYDRIGNRTLQNWLLSHPYTYILNPLGGNTPLLESVQLGTELPMSTRFYTFDAGGFLTQTAVSGPFHKTEPTAHLTFDAVGTPTDLSAGGKPLAFGYDGRGLLVRAGMGDTPYALSTYSSEGRLYSLHTIDLASRKTSESRTGLLYFAGRPVAQWREAVGGGGGGALTFLTTDHLGTPACALGEDASVTWSGGFEPFGRDWQEGSAQSALANGIFLRLPGQWDHPFWHRAPLPFGFGADLYYNVHRWYEAGTGRYVSADPLPMHLLEEDSTFIYVSSNPMVGSDPLGLCELKPCSEFPGPPPVCSCDRSRAAEAAKGSSSLARRFCANRNSAERPTGIADSDSLDPCDPRVKGMVGPDGSAQYKPQGDPCLEWCTCQHENQHVRDIKDPRVTKMMYAGIAIQQVVNWLECRAYTTGTFCLRGYAQGGQP
ncbi:MAG: RHS repeat-associated core domain-containing protein, partial [Acidobacteriota bacterium]|nr:RHS repeat-associated core domain-containing protein [Acidobacteriota bacterium]